jgi:hypothetical protein
VCDRSTFCSAADTREHYLGAAILKSGGSVLVTFAPKARNEPVSLVETIVREEFLL